MQTINVNGDGGDFLNRLIRAKKTFTCKKTGYSIEFILNGRKYLVSRSTNTHNTLLAYQKIKRDIRESNVHIDEVNQRSITYFEIEDYLKNTNEVYFPEVYNVDISNAYPQTLVNFGCLTDDTFEYINKKISKVERLKAVGMIATNKLIFEFENGLCVDVTKKNNKDLSNIFKAVCLEVGNSMHACKQVLGDSFLFSWVDGIYFTEKEQTDIMINLLSARGYNSKPETLTDFYSKREKDNYYIEYNKNGNKKRFNIPLQNKIVNSQLNKLLINYSKIKSHDNIKHSRKEDKKNIRSGKRN